MKILYFSAIEQNVGWGAECFMNQALLKHGAETVAIDYRSNRGRLGRICKTVEGIDCLFLQRGDDFPLEIIKAANVPRFFCFSELLARRHDADHLFRSGLFDHYFVRSNSCRDSLVEKGWVEEKKISVHLSAFDPNLYFKIPDMEKDIDVLFLGSLTKRRKRILKELSLQCKVEVCSAFGTEANKYFNRAKIVLNIHAEDFPDTETRVYEVLGSGTLLISETLASENPFTHEQFVEVNSVDEMCRKIDFYLKNEKDREVIATAGRAVVLENHTYARRAGGLIDVFQMVPCKTDNSFNQPLLDKFIKEERSITACRYARRKILDVIDKVKDI